MPKYKNVGVLPPEYKRLEDIQKGYIEKHGAKKSFTLIIKDLLDEGGDKVKA